MTSKPRVLFLMRDFVQAGAQRYQYEVIRALDKEQFAVDILIPLELNRSGGMFPSEYYFPLVRKHVGKMIFMSEIGSHLSRLQKVVGYLLKKVNNSRWAYNYLKNLASRLDTKRNYHLSTFLNQYDVINVTDYDYHFIRNAVKNKNKIFTFVMTASVQTFPLSPFEDYDQNTSYNLIFDYDEALAKHELSHFQSQCNNIRIPLVLDTRKYLPVKTPSRSGVFRIGVFTRLSPLKPLEPFLYALHLLVSKGLNVELHHFGAVSDQGSSRLTKIQMTQTIQLLGLTEHVFFNGHQEMIGQAAEKGGIHLVWQQSFNGVVGGYAALELMLMEFRMSFLIWK